MVLPLAPLKRISWMRMPPAVWVKCASSPPARISTNPAIANDHLRRIWSLPESPAGDRRLGSLCSFALVVIDTVSERRMRARRLRRGPPETLIESWQLPLTRLFCLRNSLRRAIESGPR